MIGKRLNGILVSDDGRPIQETTSAWLGRIRDHERCFVCGVEKSAAAFNDEHVVPKWVLKRFNLYDQVLTLPNGATVRYDRYKVPCCAACNSFLGECVEVPMSKITAGGVSTISTHIREHGPVLISTWLSLLYFKLHYRDIAIRYNRDLRKGASAIGDLHEWENIHHVYSLAVASHTGVTVHPEVIGTLVVLQMAPPQVFTAAFDLTDMTPGLSIMIRLGDAAICHNPSDLKALGEWATQKVNTITAPLSEVQAREFAGRLGFGDLLLKNRPVIGTRTIPGDPTRLEMVGYHPEPPSFHDMDRELFGQMMHARLSRFYPVLRIEGFSPDAVEALVKSGSFSFIWGQQGEFVESASRPE